MAMVKAEHSTPACRRPTGMPRALLDSKLRAGEQVHRYVDGPSTYRYCQTAGRRPTDRTGCLTSTDTHGNHVPFKRRLTSGRQALRLGCLRKQMDATMRRRPRRGAEGIARESAAQPREEAADGQAWRVTFRDGATPTPTRSCVRRGSNNCWPAAARERGRRPWLLHACRRGPAARPA
jgi:hypothetical protein